MLELDIPDHTLHGHELPDTEFVPTVEAVNSHHQAVAELPPYEVHVVKRETIGEIEITPRAEYSSELVYFSDGAIRELTRGTPNARYFGQNQSDFPISGTDALGTGPKGINRKIITGLVELGYNVEWLHHQGRHAEIPTDIDALKKMGHFLFGKSVGRSAHHQHALFDHLSTFGGIIYDDRRLLSVGDSRGAMTGEAVDALAPQYGRSVLFSDYIAACFEHSPGVKNIPNLLRIMIPREGRSLGKLIIEKAIEVVRTGNTDEITDYLGTIDFHPMNVTHELAWLWPLMSGDAGKYSKAVPLDAVGVRTLEDKDVMSQQESWQHEYSKRRGLRVINRDGTHLDLVREQQVRIDRFERLLTVVNERDISVSGVPHDEMDKVIYGQDSESFAA